MEYFFQNKRRQEGFSIPEIVVLIALFTLVMVAVMDSISTFYRLNSYTIAQTYQVDHARRGVEALTRDIREMTYADNGTFPLSVWEDTEIGFYSDIDRDNSVEYVEYILASTTLTKYVYNATGTNPTYNLATPDLTYTISEYVQNDIQNVPIFVYYDLNGNPSTATTTVTDLRYIEMSIIVNIDPIRDPGEYKLRSSASIRNLEQ